MNNVQSRIIRIAGAASLALLAACGGGGGGSSLPPGGGNNPGPTPAPTSTPTPASMSMTLSSTTLSFTSLQSQTFTLTSAGYSGTYSVSGCSGVAKAATSHASGSTTTFTVTPVAAGTCSLVVSESGGQSVTLGVTVTVTQGSIQ
jgi:hypothetical protein